MGVLAWVLLGELAGGSTSRLPAANVAESCQWPTVVAFRAGEEKCSGTLVHPEIVVTAAHCLLGGAPDHIRFGEAFSPASRIVGAAQCWTRPEYAESLDPAEDLGVCRLETPVPDIPATPLLGACATETVIEPQADVVLVGFGIPETGGEFGTKRYAFTRVVDEPRDDGTFTAGDAEVNGCDGDSGGPAMVQLTDGTWHVAGVLVSGPECGEGPSRYLAAATHLAWLEATTDRDLTPCRDADGPECRLAADPLREGDWDGWCDGVRLRPFDTCEEERGTESPGGTDAGGEPPATSGSGGSKEPASTGMLEGDPAPTPADGGCRIAPADDDRARAFRSAALAILGLFGFGARKGVAGRFLSRPSAARHRNTPVTDGVGRRQGVHVARAHRASRAHR